MKLLTLNTHSLIEENYQWKLEQFAAFIERELPDVFCQQEVNQTRTADIIPEEELEGFVRNSEMKMKLKKGYEAEKKEEQERLEEKEKSEKSKLHVEVNPDEVIQEEAIREDNHAAVLASILKQRGINYHWTWTGAKIGYGKYDEGLAVFSRSPILQTRQFYISKSHDYSNWKSRKILGIQTDQNTWFYTMHMGWWSDEEEPFKDQWERFQTSDIHMKEQEVWLLGDFNSPCDVRGEGYDEIKSYGWLDTWELAEVKDAGITVSGQIDGWRDTGKQGNTESQNGMRIDYIWTNQNRPIKKSQVVFDGSRDPIVSDHFGVMVET